MQEMETDMFGKTLFLSLGLIAAMTLGCEKKEAAPAEPADTAEVEDAMGEHADEANVAVEEAVEEAAEAVEEAADEVKEAAEKVEIPGQ
jgi:hypothetical protein